MESPLKFTLQVGMRLYRQGPWWVAECPSIHVASQGKSRAQAKKMLMEAVSLAIETYTEQGKLSAILEQARKHPESKMTAAKDDTLTIPVPLDLLIARHVEKAGAFS